jgi:hypothetical protein
MAGHLPVIHFPAFCSSFSPDEKSGRKGYCRQSGLENKQKAYF